jgi:anti-anti-sigma factor
MNLADLAFDDRGDGVFVTISGEIDLSNADAIRLEIGRATPNSALKIVLDLSALDYLDSAGIQLIYRLREQLQVRGQELELIVPERSPARAALTFAGVTDLIAVSDGFSSGFG